MPDMLYRVGVCAKPERVYEAPTTIDGLRGWWVSQTKGDAGPDGTIDFGHCQMCVLEAAPAHLVRRRCIQGPEEPIGTKVSFVLCRKEEQTFVLFWHAHRQEPVEFMHHCSTRVTPSVVRSRWM
jgi:uncharacterized protein YndB with AHSA1/START domain